MTFAKEIENLAPSPLPLPLPVRLTSIIELQKTLPPLRKVMFRNFPHKPQQWYENTYTIAFFFAKTHISFTLFTGKRTRVIRAYFHERLLYLLCLHYRTKLKLNKSQRNVFTCHGNKEICLLNMWTSTRVKNTHLLSSKNDRSQPQNWSKFCVHSPPPLCRRH